jgi:hypothetical protein
MEKLTPKYDVAISFLSRDLAIAASLNDRLSGELEVFFYPGNQEELAGTDGLESMRKPFVDGSRVVVVLYREGWGTTPWTRVEESAIKDGCLKYGWRRLFFVLIDAPERLPLWVPDTHIGFDYTKFPIDQAVGAIKARVLENGGNLAPLTPLALARRVQAEAEHIKRKERLFTSQQWIQDHVRPAIDKIFSGIIDQLTQISAETGMPIRAKMLNETCSMTDDRVSVSVIWCQRYSNVMGSLSISQFHNAIILPGENKLYFAGHPPAEMARQVFSPDLTIDGDLCWVAAEKPSERLSAQGVAERAINVFLTLAQQAGRGEIDTTSEFYRELQDGWREED